MASHYQFYMAEYSVSGVALSILHYGIFRQWHHTVNNAEYLVYNVAKYIRKLQWRRIINIASCNILTSPYRYRGNFQKNRGKISKVLQTINVTSRNISSVALRYQYCIVEYFVNDVTLSIMQNILFIVFCCTKDIRKLQWRRTTNIASRKISSISSC